VLIALAIGVEMQVELEVLVVARLGDLSRQRGDAGRVGGGGRRAPGRFLEGIGPNLGGSTIVVPPAPDARPGSR
jgi:hypothetical protein